MLVGQSVRLVKKIISNLLISTSIGGVMNRVNSYHTNNGEICGIVTRPLLLLLYFFVLIKGGFLMNNNLMMFEGNDVEVFELNGHVLFNPKHVAKVLGIKNVNDNLRKMNKSQVVKVKNSEVGNADIRKLNNAGENFLTESGVYKLIFTSRKPEAEKFSDWVTDEVLPAIRKTGGYVNDDETFISTYLPFADEQTKLLFSTTLTTVRKQNEVIEAQKNEINHKQEVINGLTDDIDVYKKKDVINRICRRRSGNYANRYKELYKCFKENFHVDLEARCEGYNLKQVKQKDKLSVIKYAELFGYIDDLYSCYTKLFEAEIDEVLDQINTIHSK